MDWLSHEPPLLLQRDLTVWLAADHPEADEAKAQLARFAELVKSPGHLHLYKITSLSLWNAASSGVDPERICRFLHSASKLGLPQTVRTQIRSVMAQYGLYTLVSDADNRLILKGDAKDMDRLHTMPAVSRLLGGPADGGGIIIPLGNRGLLKQELMRCGFPVVDDAGFVSGEALAIQLRERLPNQARFCLRDYQTEAVEAFRRGGYTGGSGVLVLPCGAGKTVVGMAVMNEYRVETLILTPNSTAVSQWKRELLEKTTLHEAQIGEYNGETKEVRPVTIATYQILTHRGSKEAPLVHMELFARRNWGLIIYDEVHLLPAPVFRMTAELQAKRRLGLTATLIREDGLESDVFSLIGPKRFEASWKQLEEQGWLAKVTCTEVRVPFEGAWREEYLQASARAKIRVAGENPLKLDVIRRILKRHSGDQVLIIGQYLDQLRQVAKETDTPLISGEMKHDEREQLFKQFRSGMIRRLVVSKVANFAVDLPDAAVAVQISGSFGSRQEEAQRLGRILRPKQGQNEARFYTLVTKDSKEQDFALNRQLFLLEQGYRYEVAMPEEAAGYIHFGGVEYEA